MARRHQAWATSANAMLRGKSAPRTLTDADYLRVWRIAEYLLHAVFVATPEHLAVVMDHDLPSSYTTAM